MEEEMIQKLLERATNICLNNTCCTHSNFSVGASLLTSDNEIYDGINIENDGIQSICAERVAFCNALVHGKKDFKAILIIGKDLKTNQFKKITPCGYCRQFMSEYANKDFIIYNYDNDKQTIYKYTLENLLPESFEYKGE